MGLRGAVFRMAGDAHDSSLLSRGGPSAYPTLSACLVFTAGFANSLTVDVDNAVSRPAVVMGDRHGGTDEYTLGDFGRWVVARNDGRTDDWMLEVT